MLDGRDEIDWGNHLVPEHDVEMRLKNKLFEICADPGLVDGVLFFLESDEERRELLEIAENGGEEATPRNLVYVAVNMDDEREEKNPK